MSNLIDDLLDPTALPDSSQSVTLVQTHISLVIVADHFVYKIKKPVNFGFLDFSTLEKRRHFCEQEVKLNRRLSEGLYIGVLPISHDGERYKFGDGGAKVVEYAVKMTRIPEKMLMKSLFRRGELLDEHLKKVAETLATFHGNAEQSTKIDEFGQPEMFKINTDENFAQTEKYIASSIQEQDFKRLRAWTNDFYERNRALFTRRVDQKKIRDCHGDLHMEHVCIGKKVYIFDCIEFNDRFRYSDILSDIAFLLMDLEFHGGVNHSKKLWSYYRGLSGETDVDALLTFYKVYRAYVRGKVTSFQVDDENVSCEEKERALSTAREYFNLACTYIEGGR